MGVVNIVLTCLPREEALLLQDVKLGPNFILRERLIDMHWPQTKIVRRRLERRSTEDGDRKCEDLWRGNRRNGTKKEEHEEEEADHILKDDIECRLRWQQ